MNAKVVKIDIFLHFDFTGTAKLWIVSSWLASCLGPWNSQGMETPSPGKVNPQPWQPLWSDRPVFWNNLWQTPGGRHSRAWHFDRTVECGGRYLLSFLPFMWLQAFSVSLFGTLLGSFVCVFSLTRCNLVDIFFVTDRQVPVTGKFISSHHDEAEAAKAVAKHLKVPVAKLRRAEVPHGFELCARSLSNNDY